MYIGIVLCLVNYIIMNLYHYLHTKTHVDDVDISNYARSIIYKV